MSVFVLGYIKCGKKIFFSVSVDCLGRGRGDAEGNMCKLYKSVINYTTNCSPHINCPNQWLFLVQASSILSIKDEIFETPNTFCGVQWSVSKELNCLLIMICLYICIFKIIFKELLCFFGFLGRLWCTMWPYVIIDQTSTILLIIHPSMGKMPKRKCCLAENKCENTRAERWTVHYFQFVQDRNID